MNIILIGENTKEFSSFEEMFQKISEEGGVINSVSDGVITINGKESKFLVTKEAIAEEFKIDVDAYRIKLREHIVALKNQGITISKPELEKLAKQFEFLTPKEVKSAKDPE